MEIKLTPKQSKKLYEALVPLANNADSDLYEIIKTLEYANHPDQTYCVYPYIKMQTGKELAELKGVSFP
jgi:hypothetical protein